MAKVMRHRVHREPHVLTVTLHCSCGYWIRAVRGLALIEAEDEMDAHVVAFDNLREANHIGSSCNRRCDTRPRTEMSDHVHSEECQPKPGDVLCIISGPTHVYAVEPDQVRWCFSCRKHVMHDWVLLGDPPEKRSPYDPEWGKRCTNCGGYNSVFPG